MRPAFRRWTSKAMSLGLDKSEFAAEQRKFAEITAAAVQASGATTAAGAAAAAGGFSEFYAGSKTMAGMEAMASAQRMYSEGTSQTGNVRGAMFASSLLSDPKYGGISTETAMSLAQIPAELLIPEHPVVQQAAREAGNSPQDVVKDISTMKAESFTLGTPRAARARSALVERYKQMAVEGKSPEEIAKTLTESEEMGQFVTAGMAQFGGGTAKPLELKSLAMKQIAAMAGGVPEGKFEEETRKKAFGEGGRLEDTEMAAIARQQEAVNNQFLRMKGELGEAATNASRFTDEVIRLHKALAAAVSDKTLTSEQRMKLMERAFGAPVSEERPSSTRGGR